MHFPDLNHLYVVKITSDKPMAIRFTEKEVFEHWISRALVKPDTNLNMGIWHAMQGEQSLYRSGEVANAAICHFQEG